MRRGTSAGIPARWTGWTALATAVVMSLPLAAGAATYSSNPVLLQASAPVVGAALGNSVAIDNGSLVSGAPSGDSGIGVADMFVRTGPAWTQTQELAPSDGAVGDEYGLAVAISGDVMAVGAPEHPMTILGRARIPGRITKRWSISLASECARRSLARAQRFDGFANTSLSWSALSGRQPTISSVVRYRSMI